MIITIYPVAIYLVSAGVWFFSAIFFHVQLASRSYILWYRWVCLSIYIYTQIDRHTNVCWKMFQVQSFAVRSFKQELPSFVVNHHLCNFPFHEILEKIDSKYWFVHWNNWFTPMTNQSDNNDRRNRVIKSFLAQTVREIYYVIIYHFQRVHFVRKNS